jgi:hypothetical protein
MCIYISLFVCIIYGTYSYIYHTHIAFLWLYMDIYGSNCFRTAAVQVDVPAKHVSLLVVPHFGSGTPEASVRLSLCPASAVLVALEARGTWGHFAAEKLRLATKMRNCRWWLLSSNSLISPAIPLGYKFIIMFYI